MRLFGMYMRFFVLLAMMTPAQVRGNVEDDVAQAASGRDASSATTEECSQMLDALKAEYQKTGESEILFTMGTCYEILGDDDRAVAYYRLYLEEATGDTEAATANIARLTGGKDRTEEGAATVPKNDRIRAASEEDDDNDNDNDDDDDGGADAGTGVSADDPVHENETAGPVETNTGTREEGASGIESSVLARGLVLGIGGLVVSSGVLTAIAAYKKYQSYEAVCAPDCSDEQARDVRRLSVAADIQMVAGLGLVTAGLVWHWVERRRLGESAAHKSVSRRPRVSLTGTHVVVEVCF